MFLECKAQESHSIISLTNQKKNLFGKILETLARDRIRLIGLGHGRLKIMTILSFYPPRNQLDFDKNRIYSTAIAFMLLLYSILQYTTEIILPLHHNEQAIRGDR